MKTYCGANCRKCDFKKSCPGCEASCGSPFGGKCIAAEKIQEHGIDAYRNFKEKLRTAINTLLKTLGLPEAKELYELAGSLVNMEYTLPNGQKAKFLDDKNVYLGTEIALPDRSLCCGVVADDDFVLICAYGKNGADPKLLMYFAV